MITQEEVRERFDYIDGGLYYKHVVCNRIAKGRRFGAPMERGYRYGSFNYKRYLEHKLIFLYHYGYIPKGIDHIDRDTTNNRIENLREATQSNNRMNSSGHKGTSSIYKGVFKHSYLGPNPWYAQIAKDKVKYHLGCFPTEIEAAVTYNNAAIELFGEFACLNNIVMEKE